jgi:hypothetical protein
MKIDIGPYRSDIIPVRRWESRYEFWRGYLAEEEYTKVDRFVFGFFNKLYDLVSPLNQWSNSRTRKLNVQIDDYDVWSADHTLGIIITPVLKKLKEIKHGSPSVDNEDVPEELRSTEKDWLGTTDSKYEARWNYVLDEMIWAFGQHGLEDDTEQYYDNIDQLEVVFNDSKLSFNHQKDLSKPPYFRDDEGLKKHEERKANGRRLFAKYYEALWD